MTHGVTETQLALLFVVETIFVELADAFAHRESSSASLPLPPPFLALCHRCLVWHCTVLQMCHRRLVLCCRRIVDALHWIALHCALHCVLHCGRKGRERERKSVVFFFKALSSQKPTGFVTASSRKNERKKNHFLFQKMFLWLFCSFFFVGLCECSFSDSEFSSLPSSKCASVKTWTHNVFVLVFHWEKPNVTSTC